VSLANDLNDFLVKRRLIKGGQAVKKDESLLETGIIDSLAILELTAHLEETYGITIEEDDLVPENFDTLSAIECYVDSKRGPPPVRDNAFSAG
jgi:acyl carrier protein